MIRCGFLVVMLMMAPLWVSCLTTTFDSLKDSVSKLAAQPQDPASARINPINSELAAIEAEISHLRSAYHAAESQRHESFAALGEIHGIGPKAPKSAFDETRCEDPGMLITMHNPNLTAANGKMREITAKTKALISQFGKSRVESAGMASWTVGKTKIQFPKTPLKK